MFVKDTTWPYSFLNTTIDITPKTLNEKKDAELRSMTLYNVNVGNNRKTYDVNKLFIFADFKNTLTVNY